MEQASEVFKTNEDHELLSALKTAGWNGEKERVDELSVKYEEHSEQLQEVCGHNIVRMCLYSITPKAGKLSFVDLGNVLEYNSILNVLFVEVGISTIGVNASYFYHKT